MKIARYLPLAILGLFVGTTGASADPSATDPVDNPYIQSDPDGVPLSVTRPQPKKLSQEEINAIHKQQERAALNKNWLLRNYEQQQRARAAANSPGSEDTDLFFQLSSNKDLAKLAGLPVIDSDNSDSTNPFQTGAPPSSPESTASHDKASSAATGGASPSNGELFKPLITPLTAPDAAGLHNFYSTLPVSMPSPLLPGNFRPKLPAPQVDQSQDSSDIETPGMVAAKNDPLMDPSDLTLDILPGETVEQARAHQDNDSKLELPLPMDANQLHKEQAAALRVPGVPTAAQPATTTTSTVPPVPVDDPNAPLPVSKTPPINPVRTPIANPYDILNR